MLRWRRRLQAAGRLSCAAVDVMLMMMMVVLFAVAVHQMFALLSLTLVLPLPTIHAGLHATTHSHQLRRKHNNIARDDLDLHTVTHPPF